ncbi:MAG TPA: class I SAM-dependent methyltransferase, partial [Syntrophomonadaceae bacterium]|nr:class I SAM-dependent methyltransferase [Syntrophomonadaceae bacterium]
AINLAKKNNLNITIYHGSVTDMPFDRKIYDGIFCYGLIYLLNKQERHKFIKNCYKQLKLGGYMIFTTISKESQMYGKGKQLGENYFEISEGMKLFFYDSDSIKQEFGEYGLIESSEIVEPHKNAENKPPFKFIIVKCQK